MTTFFFDQIDELKKQLSIELEQTKEIDEQDCIEAIYEILLLAYVYGVEDVNEMLGISAKPNAGKLKDALAKKYDGKDYTDRIIEYAVLGDIEGIIRVAETEAHRLYMTSAFATAKENGATMKTWNAVGDEKTRDTHIDIDGVEIPIDTPFVTFDGDEAMFPGDFSMASNNANCRCDLLFS